jgi:hypothetical protein
VLESKPLDGVVQLDVDAEVVGIQLQLVSGDQATPLVDVHGQRGDLAVNLEAPMTVRVRRGPKLDVSGRHRRASVDVL